MTTYNRDELNREAKRSAEHDAKGKAAGRPVRVSWEIVLQPGAAPCLRVSYSAVGVLHTVYVAI